MKVAVQKSRTPVHHRIHDLNDWNMMTMMNQFLDERFGDMTDWWESHRGLLTGWRPRADITEKKDHFIIHADIPGVDPTNISIELEGNTLILSGKKEEEKEEEGKMWYKLEREQGEFRRSFELPNEADVDSIHAKTKNGTVVIEIKKKAETQRKKIKIEA